MVTNNRRSTTAGPSTPTKSGSMSSKFGMRPLSTQQGRNSLQSSQSTTDALNLQIAQLKFNTPGPNQPLQPAVTPLAHRYPHFDPSRMYAGVAGPPPDHQKRISSTLTIGTRPPSSLGGPRGASSGSQMVSMNSGVGPGNQMMGPLPLDTAMMNTLVQPLMQSTGSMDYQGFNSNSGVQLTVSDQEWRDIIFTVFKMVAGWVKLHCGEVNEDLTAQLATKFPRLWEYICSITYPQNMKNAASHAIYMLNDKLIRPIFISRLLLQYVVQKMWDPKSWEGWNDDLTEVLEESRLRLERSYGYGRPPTPPSHGHPAEETLTLYPRRNPQTVRATPARRPPRQGDLGVHRRLP